MLVFAYLGPVNYRWLCIGWHHPVKAGAPKADIVYSILYEKQVAIKFSALMKGEFNWGKI